MAARVCSLIVPARPRQRVVSRRARPIDGGRRGEARAADEGGLADEPVADSTMLESDARIYVEPWPAGGWVVRLEGHPAPVSRHDTQEEAEFRAAAYRSVVERGHRLAFDAGEHGERTE